MNCDYFAGSPHKWLFAPAGSGILYIREERLDEHFPVIATAGWDDKSMKAGRFMRFGTNNRAIIEGLMAGLAFAKSIGPEMTVVSPSCCTNAPKASMHSSMASASSQAGIP